VLSGDFTVNGFRNRDLQGKLYPAAATDVADAKRRTHRTSRLIAKLRGHGLITRVKNSRLYRLTAKGFKAMWPAVRFRRIDFPPLFEPPKPHRNFHGHVNSWRGIAYRRILNRPQWRVIQR